MVPPRRDAGRHLDTADVIERFSISRKTLYAWLKDETLQFPQPFRINGRNYFRESEIVAFEAACGADDDVERAHGCPIVSPVITKYEDFVVAMRQRKADLGLTNDEVELLAGLADGHLTKLENYGMKGSTSGTTRGMGPETFPLWLGGLRVGIILVDLPRRAYRPRKRNADYAAA